MLGIVILNNDVEMEAFPKRLLTILIYCEALQWINSTMHMVLLNSFLFFIINMKTLLHTTSHLGNTSNLKDRYKHITKSR